MNDRQLYYFTQIAEADNISAAAKRLGMSQPSLSKQLAELENELGLQLIERGARRTLLTDAGYFLYQRAKNITSMMASTAEDLRRFESGAPAILRLGTISSCGSALLQSCLFDFCHDFPDLQFEISEGNTYELLEKLKTGQIEVAVVRTPFNTKGLTCFSKEAESLVAVARPSLLPHPDAPSISLTELSSLPLLYYRRFEQMIYLAFRGEGLSHTCLCKSDDARTALMWASAGLGVALVPRSISALFAASLIAQPIACSDLVTCMAAVHLKNAPLSLAAQHFLTYWQKGELHEAKA
ncbi:MAG: LysR family transcriptional regulator [Lachnospiraceae bacterium]|jgi:DNA-binding transcriptional LysR family regulator|nr:LysR family transcriptional regulator [Lachnospiraceae bacterium]